MISHCSRIFFLFVCCLGFFPFFLFFSAGVFVGIVMMIVRGCSNDDNDENHENVIQVIYEWWESEKNP